MATPFPVSDVLTSIVIAYTNKMLVADGVLPRVPTSYRFSFQAHDKGEGFSLPETRVGRRGKPNVVEFTGTETIAQVESFALEDEIPNLDIKAAEGTKWDPVANSAEMLVRLIDLDRERRVAALVFDYAIYSSSNKKTLSGSDQWSHADSHPITEISAALDAMIMRGNQMVIGQEAWTKLSTHPDIIGAITHVGTGARGMATAEAVAELFGLEKIHVGAGFLNTAKKGQTPTLSRVWGKHCVLFYQEAVSNTRTASTFGFTGQLDTRKAGELDDPYIGADGGKRVRVWERVKEVISAADFGYMLKDVVA